MADLPRRLIEIHRMRPDLRELFDLSTGKGRSRLYWWYYLHGFLEMWLGFNAADDVKGPAVEPVPHLPSRHPIAVTWLMREFWLRGLVPGSEAMGGQRGASARQGGRRSREPNSSQDQKALIDWYFCQALSQFNLEGLLTKKQASALLRGVDDRADVPLILTMVHSAVPDMHDRFPDPADAAWRVWCATEGRQRFPILDHPLLAGSLFGQTLSRPARVFEGRPNGVNLIGHAGTRSGVGEDLRMAAKALEAVRIPFVVHNIEPSTGVGSSDELPDAPILDQTPFRVNMFCMAGMETVTVLSRRRDLLEGKFSIGFWPWELERWPDLWSHALHLMDELWASSHFTAEAYRQSADVPVRQVPMAVDVSGSEGLTRSDFNLPEDAFLFAYAFDGHSSFARKNPEASVAAFARAFPNGAEPVGLVLKGLRVGDHPAWQQLKTTVARDPRIILLSESMPRGRLLDLYRAIDCLVSLHRSEGFGRNIAECMLLGKPVIATDYSGNVDFTTKDTAAMVQAALKPLEDGEYPFGTGQRWADPDIGEAADSMRRIFSDAPWRERIARSGQQLIRTKYSPTFVGDRFRQELARVTRELSKRTTGEHF